IIMENLPPQNDDQNIPEKEPILGQAPTAPIGFGQLWVGRQIPNINNDLLEEDPEEEEDDEEDPEEEVTMRKRKWRLMMRKIQKRIQKKVTMRKRK
ncbi:hypothetical protein Tco_0483268, partial [Tanacetum coccineum]